MKEYMIRYEKWIKDKISENLTKEDKIKLSKYHMTQIEFMQHERLIHLIVTVATIMIFLGSFYIFYNNINLLFGILFIIVGALTFAYIIHYYRLENTVQRWYEIYNQLMNEW